MFKKGNKPHNKGDDRVDMHYRNKSKMPRRMMKDDDMYEKPIDKFGGSNPFRINIDMSDLVITRNSIKRDTIGLF